VGGAKVAKSAAQNRKVVELL